MQVEVGQRVAVDVGLRVLEPDGPLALLRRVVPAERVALEGLEQVVERLVLDRAGSPSGVTRHLPSLVLLDQAFLLDQLDDLGHLVLEVVEVAEDLVAVLEHVFGELVEDLVGRLRQELLRAVPLGVFITATWSALRRSPVPHRAQRRYDVAAGLGRLVQLVVHVQPFEDELGGAGGGGLAGVARR